MHRFIDAVMLHSDRLDERARLIARLADVIAPYVEAATPAEQNAAAVVRRSVLRAVRRGHDNVLDLVAAALDHAALELDSPRLLLPDLPPGPALTAALCDGRGVPVFGLAAAFGFLVEDVAVARDRAREALGLPPALMGCALEYTHDLRHVLGCADCLLSRCDAQAAAARISELGGVPTGPIVDLVLARSRRAPLATDAPPDGPTPWIAVVEQTA